MSIMIILMMSLPLMRRQTIKPRRLRWILLLKITMIIRNLEPPPMRVVYGGLLEKNHKVHLMYQSWAVRINMKKL